MQNEDGLSPFWNTHSERVPPFGLIKPTGEFDEQGRMKITKPDTDSEDGLWVNSEISVESNAGGGAYVSHKTTVSYSTEDGIPSPGEERGSKADDWYARKGQAGFKCIAGKGGVMNAVRVDRDSAWRGDYWSTFPYGSPGWTTGSPLGPTDLGMGFNIDISSTGGSTIGTVKEMTVKIPAGSGVVDIWGVLTGYVTSVPDPSNPGAALWFMVSAFLRAVDSSGNPTTYTSDDPDVPDITYITWEGTPMIHGQMDLIAGDSGPSRYGDIGPGNTWYASTPVHFRRVRVGSDNDLYLTFAAYGFGQWPTNPTTVFFAPIGVGVGSSYILWKTAVGAVTEPYIWTP